MTDSNDGRIARFITLVLMSALLLVCSPFIVLWLIFGGTLKKQVDEAFRRRQERKNREAEIRLLKRAEELGRKNFQKN